MSLKLIILNVKFIRLEKKEEFIEKKNLLKKKKKKTEHELTSIDKNKYLTYFLFFSFLSIVTQQ